MQISYAAELWMLYDGLGCCSIAAGPGVGMPTAPAILSEFEKLYICTRIVAAEL
jgi:hypothetical protein